MLSDRKLVENDLPVRSRQVLAHDDDRLKRVLAIIEEMRRHAPFLILTCHPERYRQLKNARLIDMETLRS